MEPLTALRVNLLCLEIAALMRLDRPEARQFYEIEAEKIIGRAENLQGRLRAFGPKREEEISRAG